MSIDAVEQGVANIVQSVLIFPLRKHPSVTFMFPQSSTDIPSVYIRTGGWQRQPVLASDS